MPVAAVITARLQWPAKTAAGRLRLSGAARGWVEVYDALMIHSTWLSRHSSQQRLHVAICIVSTLVHLETLLRSKESMLWFKFELLVKNMDSKISKISDWIKEQGYPLEMYCENILSQYNFSVIQSLHYEDEETKKYREIDILGTKFINRNGVTFNFSLVIECKLSKEKPWLLFSRKQHKDHKDDVLENIFMTKNGKLLMKKSSKIEDLSLISYDGEKVGFNLTQCFTSGKDIPYQAIMSTINACDYLVKKSNESNRTFCNFYFPVIVIDGDMYGCQTGAAGELQIDSIQIGKLLTIRSYSERSSILHTIVTKGGFRMFIEQLSFELTDLFEKITPGFDFVSQNKPINSSPDYTFL